MKGFTATTNGWLHLLGWGFILLLINGNIFTWRWQFYQNSDGSLLIPSLYGSVFNALIFYGNALWLYPKRKTFSWSGGYWLWALVLLAVLSLTEGTIDYYYSRYHELIPAPVQQVPAIGLIVGLGINCGTIHLLYWLSSFVYTMLRQRRHLQQQQAELSQQKLTAELQYLKAQINPHVLFNGINSVYHLIDEQPEQARHTLLTFSNLLRYQLYDCQEDTVPLNKELAHLSDYIALEETRKGEDAVINWEIQDSEQPAQIAPMLLQPFVENAFKHLSHHDKQEENRLQLLLAIDKEILSLTVDNTVASPTNVKDPEEVSGVGLANVKRRLQLIYPDRHQLFISRPTGLFRVHLIITL